MEEVKITRGELYEKVWSTPLTQLAKEYKISDVGLRKKCIKHDIPLPKGGHWSKVQHGKKVKKPSLPGPEDKSQITLFIRDDNGNSYDPIIDDRIRIKHEINELFQEYLEPTKRLARPHHLILAVKKHLENQKPNYDNEIKSDSGQFLNITASKALLPISLRVFNSFIRLAEARGHEIKIIDHSTVVIIDGIEIKINIRERQKRVIDKSMSTYYPYPKKIPSGVLSFRRDDSHKREWDNSKKSIESQFPSILANLEAYAIKEKQWKIEAEKSRIKREAEEKIQREKYELKVEEYSKYNQLLQDASRWQKAELIRSYITQMGNNTTNIEWFQWATKKANWVDPSIDIEDDILGFYSEEPPSKPRNW